MLDRVQRQGPNLLKTDNITNSFFPFRVSQTCQISFFQGKIWWQLKAKSLFSLNRRMDSLKHPQEVLFKKVFWQRTAFLLKKETLKKGDTGVFL